MSSAKRPPSCLGLNESMSQWVNEAKNELMKPRLYLLWIHLCTFFPMFAIHMCEKIWVFFPEILVRHYVLCVCTCTNQLVLSTEVTRLNFLNSIVMGQINQCGFQSHVAIDRYCIFLEINTFELSWVELSWINLSWVPPTFHTAGLILGLRPANKRRNKVTPSLIGWAQT